MAQTQITRAVPRTDPTERALALPDHRRVSFMRLHERPTADVKHGYPLSHRFAAYLDGVWDESEEERLRAHADQMTPYLERMAADEKTARIAAALLRCYFALPGDAVFMTRLDFAREQGVDRRTVSRWINRGIHLILEWERADRASRQERAA